VTIKLNLSCLLQSYILCFVVVMITPQPLPRTSLDTTRRTRPPHCVESLHVCIAKQSYRRCFEDTIVHQTSYAVHSWHAQGSHSAVAGSRILCADITRESRVLQVALSCLLLLLCSDHTTPLRVTRTILFHLFYLQRSPSLHQDRIAQQKN